MKKSLKPLLWLLVLVMSISLVAVFSSVGCMGVDESVVEEVTDQPIEESEKVEEQSINILSPNGGEVWIEGNTYNITWDSSGIEKVNLAVACGGKAWDIAFGVGAKSGVYSWKIPDGLISGFGITKSDAMKVRVYDEKNSSIYGENDNYFTIIAVEETTTKGKIAFTSDRDRNYEIYIINVDGSGQINLTDNPANDFCPCFSH